MNNILKVENDEAFANILSSAGTKLVVVDFFATWCQPCHMIKPKFKEFSVKYLNAKFLEVDVDQCQEVAESLGITAMPTFLFFKNNVKVDSFKGADPHGLEEKLIKWNAEDGEGDDVGVKGQMDLSGFVELKGCELLNACTNQSLSNVLKEDSDFILSDCDEQLILMVSFNQVVKLHSLKIVAPADNGPKTLKLFINQHKTLDFDSAESMEAVQEFNLTTDDIQQGSSIPLRFVKFQNVSNLTLFIQSNQQDQEVTRLDYLAFIGSPATTTNMNDFKRVAGKKGESH